MENERYTKHILIKTIGKKGQNIISNSKIVIIGCGALGCVISNNLVRAGIGTIKIIDRDFVELNNIHRQILFNEKDAQNKLPKVVAAANKLSEINSDINILYDMQDVNSDNIESIIENYDIILDATDNMETRFIINDVSIKMNIPWIYGGVVHTIGMSMNIIPNKTPCFRCIMESLPTPGSIDTCDSSGILNTLPVIIGSIQSTEAIKILVDLNNINKDMIYIDAWKNSFSKFNIEKNSNCICCKKNKFEFLNKKLTNNAVSLCGRNSVQIMPSKTTKISLEEIKNQITNVNNLSFNGFLLSFQKDGYNWTIFPNGRIIIQGTSDIKKAKVLCSRVLGM